VFARPGAPTIVAASVLGRLPLSMTPFTLVLLERSHGRSYAVAGLVGAPLLGRAADRVGVARVLTPAGVVFSFALGVTAFAGRGQPLVLTLALAIVSGASLPPIGASMRALWPSLVLDRALVGSAFAVEAVVQELAFVLGPPLVALIVALTSARVATVGTAVIGLAGALAFVVASGERPGSDTERRSLSSAWGNGIAWILMITLMFGVAVGAVEVAMPAFAERHGSRPVAGLLLAALSGGSLLGGLLWSRPAHAGSQSRRYRRALGVFAIALAPLLLAGSVWLMGLFMLLAGAPIAGSFASSYGLLGELSAPGRMIETFAWVSTAVTVGAAVGSALGGLAIRVSGYRTSLLIAILAQVGAYLVALMAGERLDPSRRTSPTAMMPV
jgi:MFS family permease